MKIKVIVYLTNQDGDRLVIQVLTQAGIIVSTVKNLTQMHIQLTSQNVDAFLVNADFMTLHGISPERYLRERRSPLSIICYSYTQNGEINIHVYQLSETVSGIPDTPNRAEKTTQIETTLRSLNTIAPLKMKNKSINPTKKLITVLSVQHTDFLNEAGLRLHKKMRLMLEALIQAGSQGIDIQLLADIVWGTKGIDKKSDIQSYICKLKTFLDISYTKKYHIERIKNLYFLVDESKNDASKKVLT